MRAIFLLAVLIAPFPLAAQGLGDTAARERQKREEKKAASPAKIYSNQDLPGSAEAVAPGDAGSPGAEPPAASSPKEESPTGPERTAVSGGAKDPLDEERKDRKRLEAEWRLRFATAREQLANAEADSWREVVRTEYYQGIPVPMKIKEQVETEELRQARKALADLQEEFRRTGLPSGWAREP